MSGIRPGSRVTLHYRLACQDQLLVDTFADQEAETFILGGGDIDPRLEALLLDLVAGDRRTWNLDPGEAFGHLDPALVHDLPRRDFAPDTELREGLQMAFHLPNGQSLNGIVREISPDTVRVDFNHPLASLPVDFEVQILAVE
ncbi:MAG: peptidylprolyl isomerase [Pseudomonadota bacterium]